MPAAAILLAAGRGDRLGGDRPKAFLRVGGRTLLDRAVAAVEAVPELEGFVVAAPAGHEEEAKAATGGSPRFLAVMAGGDSRQASVRRALEAVPRGFDVVVCHDVARPFASPELFTAVLDALERAEGAVPVVAVSDTVKRIADGRVTATIPREELGLAQTPQAFRREELERAHAAAAPEGFLATDDAALLERIGGTVAAVAGDPWNLKITTWEDLERAEAWARALERS